MKIPRIHFELADEELSLIVIAVDDLKVEKSSKSFQEHEQAVFEELRSNYSLASLKDNPVFRSYRDLYWRFGMDPTKTRVSSEALLRRILRGENLWRINSIVDSMNLASAYHSIPIGLADSHKVVGDVFIRQAHPKEVFTRIGGKEIQCRGREIVIADERGAFCFGFATHDSERTKITENTTSAFVYLCISPEISLELKQSSTETTLKFLDDWVLCDVADVHTATA